jgi:hypothetical protein
MVFTEIARCRVTLAVLCSLPAFATLAAPVIPNVEPHVPKAAGTPCVVELFHNQPFDDLTSFAYAPPPACPGPWSKVILKADLSGSRGANTSIVTATLGGVSLFNSAVSQTQDETGWHVERDLTDYAALLKVANDGELDMVDAGTPYVDSVVTGSARLLFYRASPATPAHRVPDAVYQVQGDLTLPHNIVRAYLDVTARGGPLWYTCVPDASASSWPALLSVLAPGINPPGIFAANQGCTGGSFREVEVSIDGTPAGVVQVFPWLPSDFNGVFPNSVDTPMPGAQGLNLVPYRIDLTPFAAVLSEAGDHTVSLDGGAWTDSQLLLYLDHGSTHVTGAVTFNTLAAGVPTPTVTNSLAASGGILQGQINTQVNRDFEIRGFVNTSGGRIDAKVTQSGTFSNLQDLRLEGLVYAELHSYRQNVSLVSTVDRRSRRTRSGTVLSDDHERIRYPLSFRFKTYGEYGDSGDGPQVSLVAARMSVDQKRHVDGEFSRPGMAPYQTKLKDDFVASHWRYSGIDSNWTSTRKFVFKDNFGSCYKKLFDSTGGVLAGTSSGVGCPGGVNTLRWFSHPDGSPDALTWRP